MSGNLRQIKTICEETGKYYEYNNDGEVKNVSDAELIKLLRTQPEEGCKALLEQYTGMVLAICRRRLGGLCTAEDIEELTSDILFMFWQKRDTLSDERGNIRALLSTMAYRRCIDYYRSNSTRLSTRTQPVEEIAEFLPDENPTPEEQAVTAERSALLMDALRRLDPADADLIIRKYYRGETAAAIAETLGMRTGTVEMRLSRIRQKLRSILEGGGNDDA